MLSLSANAIERPTGKQEAVCSSDLRGAATKNILPNNVRKHFQEPARACKHLREHLQTTHGIKKSKSESFEYKHGIRSSESQC